jgi:hypothetical protein
MRYNDTHNHQTPTTKMNIASSMSMVHLSAANLERNSTGFPPHYHTPLPILTPFAGMEYDDKLRSLVPKVSKYPQLRWQDIIRQEQKRAQLLKVDYIVGFTSSSKLPNVIASKIASFKYSLSDTTIIKLIDFAIYYKDLCILLNGRGGEGLTMPLSLTPLHKHKLWLLKNQQPRKQRSQPDFLKEIRNRAYIILYRQCKLCGNVETQISMFLLILLHLA